jgi:hypothetical protein
MHGFRSIWLMVGIALFSGCEVGRTMFQMDSNSGSPFMGIDLLPARKTSASQREKPESQSVVSNTESTPAIRTAEQAPVTRSEPSLLESLKLKRPDRIPLALSAPDETVATGPTEFR